MKLILTPVRNVTKGRTMALVLMVGLGGFIGTTLRYLLGLTLVNHSISYLPLPTLIINLLGSFLIGIMIFLGQARLGQYWFFLVPGILGGFTTYSAFSGEVMMLIKNHLFPQAMLYVVSTVLGGLLATSTGYILSKALFSPS